MAILCQLTFGIFGCLLPNNEVALPKNDESAWQAPVATIAQKSQENIIVKHNKANIKIIDKKSEQPKAIEKIIYIDKPIEIIREIERLVEVYPNKPEVILPNYYAERLANIELWQDDMVQKSDNNHNSLPVAPILKPAKYSAPSDISSPPVPNDNIIAQDRYIMGILENNINSQIAGTIIIQIPQNIYGYHGRNILIPKGSRMICEYEVAGGQGISRLESKCNRILMGETRAEINQIKSVVGDVQGTVGIAGEVDNRFYEKYGLAFLLAGVSVGTRIGTATIANKSTITNNNNQSNQTNPLNQAFDEGAKELSQKFGEISAQSLQESLSIKPIIRVTKGTRIQIRPAKDWIISTLN